MELICQFFLFLLCFIAFAYTLQESRNKNAVVKIYNIMPLNDHYSKRERIDQVRKRENISKVIINNSYVHLVSPDGMWEHSHLLFRVRNIHIQINPFMESASFVHKIEYCPKGFYFHNYLLYFGEGMTVYTDLYIYLHSEKELKEEITNIHSY